MCSDYYQSARPEEGLEANKRLFNRGPDWRYYLEKRMVKEAAPLVEQEYQKDPGSPWKFGHQVLLLALQGKHQEARAIGPFDSEKGAKIPWISSRHLHHRPHLRAGGQERRSLEVAACDGQRRLPLLPALCARLVPGPDPQRSGLPSVHGRDENALGALPARARMSFFRSLVYRLSGHYRPCAPFAWYG